MVIVKIFKGVSLLCELSVCFYGVVICLLNVLQYGSMLVNGL